MATTDIRGVSLPQGTFSQSILSATGSLWLNIEAFGGAGDNATDNSAPLSLALAALPVRGGGVYFPPGKYKCNSGVTFNLPGGIFAVALVGAGQDATELTWPGGGGITLNYAGISSSVHVRDMTLTTGTTNVGSAITLNLSGAVVNPAVTAISDIYRVTMRGADGYVGIDYWNLGISIKNVSNVNIEGVAIFGAASPAGGGIGLIGLVASATYAVQFNIAKSTFSNLNIAIVYQSYVQGVSVDQCNFTGINVGIDVPASQSGILSQLSVTNSQFAPNASGNAIALGTAIVNGIDISNNLFIAAFAGVVSCNLANYGYSIVSANEFIAPSNSGTTGINWGTPSSSVVTGVAEGNAFVGHGVGISIIAAAKNVTIQGNMFGQNNTNIGNSSTSNITIINNPGYNPVGPAAIVVGASPFTYTAGASPETVYIFSGTVSSVTFDKNGGALGVVASNQSPCTVELGPYEQVKVTYTGAPFMNTMIH